MFMPRHILFQDWIEDFTFGLLYVISRFSTRIFYRCVPGFATDGPCGVWCRGFTTCLLYVDPYFRNLVWDDSGFVNSCITRKPVHYTCGPAVAGQRRSGIGLRRSESGRSGIGSGALRHARMGIKIKSNDNKTTLVALLTSLLFGGGICASGKFALANISTLSTSAEGQELSWCLLCRRWWHRRLSKWQPPMPRLAAGWHRRDSLSSRA